MKGYSHYLIKNKNGRYKILLFRRVPNVGAFNKKIYESSHAIPVLLSWLIRQAVLLVGGGLITAMLFANSPTWLLVGTTLLFVIWLLILLVRAISLPFLEQTKKRYSNTLA